MTGTIINFPHPFHGRVEVTTGVEKETGRALYLFDIVEGDERFTVHECHDLKQVARMAAEFLAKGMNFVWELA